MQLAGSIETKSTHPIGKAFTDYMKENKIAKLQVNNFEDVSGFGIIGEIQKQKIILGNRKILTKYNIENKYEEDEKELAKQGNSIIYVIKDSKIMALIGVNDIIRENAKQVIEKINEKILKQLCSQEIIKIQQKK